MTLLQPIHTLYGGAHLYGPDAVAKVRRVAQATLAEYGTEGWLAAPSALLAVVRGRMEARLADRPVDDQRIDFEDGYGPRSDEEEDGHAVRAAQAMAQGLAAGALPPLVGIRIKALGAGTRARAERTLARFFGAFAEASPGRLPDPFVVTLPKVTSEEEVRMFVELTDTAVGAVGLPRASLRFELMIEHPAALLDAEGRVPLRRFVGLLGERAFAFHLGAYDLTAELGVSAVSQRLDHPHLDAARTTLLLALAGTGVHVVDGATTRLPVVLHKSPKSDEERAENRASVASALRLHAGHVRRALDCGIHQGWDLHPAQLLARYGALYMYYLENVDAMRARRARFAESRAQATRVGALFDDAATARAVEDFFHRGVACGALPPEDLGPVS
jgi:hypothetical protein